MISCIGDHPRDGDHLRMVIKVWPTSRNGQSPRDRDYHRNANIYGTATVVRMVTILEMATVLGTVIVHGMGNIRAIVRVDKDPLYS